MSACSALGLQRLCQCMRRTSSMASRAACMRRKQAAHASELRPIACRLSSAMPATAVATLPPLPFASHRSRAADGACDSVRAQFKVPEANLNSCSCE